MAATQKFVSVYIIVMSACTRIYVYTYAYMYDMCVYGREGIQMSTENILQPVSIMSQHLT